MGDWRFDEAYWPDPESMIGEMVADGTEVMVSVWPTVNPESENYSEMHRRGFLADTEYGPKPLMEFTDADTEGTKTLYYYDPFNPEARQFVWSKVKQNYFDKGVKIFWLDACEPEAYPYDPGNVRYHAGRGDEVGCAYPFVHQKGFYEGMKRAGLDNPINLCRSAWAGSQRFGAAVWSGDIDATFDALRTQVTAGLQMAMSGIPWWTTDIGGFFANPTDDPKFRELLIRWFQYGAFCPIFRLHGFRDSDDFKRGGDNEVWSFGEKVYAIAGNLLHLREALKPYMRKQMKEAARSGVPPMRPLFFDYASDKAAYEVADQFLFGPDIMIAPILEYRARSREVYIPEGSQFLDVRTGQEVPGGERITANAEIESIPVYAREGSEALKILRDFL